MGGDATVIEHMTKTRSENPACLCVCCRRCNSQKGNLSVYEWLDKIDQQLAAAEALKIRRGYIIIAIESLGGRVHATSN